VKAIWKFPLGIHDEQHITMPVGAKPLSAQVQHGAVCLWMEVDTKAERAPRRVCIFGTGHEHEGTAFDGLAFVSTTQTGPLVWHIYVEETP
jgi:hypothetical protein